MVGVSTLRMRILIIEDEQKMAGLLKKGLEEENHIVMLAHTGVDGLELSRTYPFDVIILDVMLPGMTGFEVARQLRQSNNHVPILILRHPAASSRTQCATIRNQR